MRSALDGFAVFGRLAVEHAQRVVLEPPLRVGRERPGDRPEVREQRLAVGAAAGGVADRVDLERRVHAVRAQQFRRDVDDLDVGLGFRVAETLDPELVRLAEAPLLRALVAVERADVVEPLRALRQQVVLQQCPHHRRR